MTQEGKQTEGHLLIHALIISDDNGRFLVELVRNNKLETARLTGFISALKMFGEETLGNIRDISINGLDIDMVIVSKFNLIFIAIMDSDIPELNFREGCERALDVFHKIFKDKIDSWDGDLSTFRDFKNLLNGQVERYFKELDEDYKSNEEIQEKTFVETKMDAVMALKAELEYWKEKKKKKN